MPKSKRLLVLVGLIAFAASPLVAQGPKDKAKDEAPKVAAPNTTPEIGNIVADYTTPSGTSSAETAAPA
jgi:hypothetical protein